MESTSGAPTPRDAAAALADAEHSRNRLAESFELPAHHHLLIGAAVAVQVASAAIGIALGTPGALALLVAGVIVFGIVASVELLRFRRRNGVWVHGFASRAVLGTSAVASLAYAGGLATSTAAAFHDLWWLVLVCAAVGGAAYALGARSWWRAYRRDPVAHATAESVLLLASLAVLAAVGLVLLVVAR